MVSCFFPQKFLSNSNFSANGNENGNNTASRKANAVKLPNDFNVEEYISSKYVRRAKSKQSIQQRVSDAHGNVRQLTATEAKLQYIRAWQALPEHGIHYFIVRFRNARKAELVAVAINRLAKLNMDNGESLKTWRFSNMKKWHINWEIRHLKVRNCWNFF